jgi:hypothetical protein
MATAVIAARFQGYLAPVIALEAVLACLVVVLRLAAKRRWTEIDWMRCRSDRIASSRYAS